MRFLSLSAAVEHVAICPGAVTATQREPWPDWIEIFDTVDLELIMKVTAIKGLRVIVYEVASIEHGVTLGHITSIPARGDLGIRSPLFIATISPEAQAMYEPGAESPGTARRDLSLTAAQKLKLIAKANADGWLSQAEYIDIMTTYVTGEERRKALTLAIVSHICAWE